MYRRNGFPVWFASCAAQETLQRVISAARKIIDCALEDLYRSWCHSKAHSILMGTSHIPAVTLREAVQLEQDKQTGKTAHLPELMYTEEFPSSH